MTLKEIAKIAVCEGTADANAMDAQPNQPMTDLQKHDAKFHGGHYDGQGECKFREGMAKDDESDKISGESSSRQSNRLHPIAPPKSQAEIIPDFTQVDLDDLKDARSRLEVAARCLNGRVGNLQALQTSSRFTVLDSIPDDTAFYQRLDDLSKNKNAKVAAVAGELKQIADNIASSKKGGWDTPAGMVDDAGTFEGKLPSVQSIPPPLQSEAEKRKMMRDFASSLLNSKDDKSPKAIAQALLDADATLTDLEENIAAFDEALAKESNPSVKKDLVELKNTIDEAYFNADKAYKDAESAIKKWEAGNIVMNSTFTCDDAVEFYQSRGLAVPAGVANWKDHIKWHEKQSEAIVARELGHRPMWKTKQDRIDRINQLRKNWQMLLPHIHIYHLATDYAFDSLKNEGAVRARESSGRYHEAMRNAFGAKGNLTAKDMQLYCVASLEENPMNGDWFKSLGRDIVVEIDPKKFIGGVLYDNGCGYWDRSSPQAMNPLSQIGFTDIAYGNGRNQFNPESAEVDFEGMTPRQMFDTMFPQGEASNEMHIVNGASFDQGNIKALWTEGKCKDSAVYSALKANGVKNIDLYTGNEM